MSNRIDDVPEPRRGARSGDSGSWERYLVNRLAFAAVREQRRARRWNLLFRFLILAYVTLLMLFYLPQEWIPEFDTESHAALVDVRGVISEKDEASAERIVRGLRAAFEDADTAGVILRINSPGGSPVQAGYVNDEISRLREKYPDIPLYAVITDVCASGGYYVAAAADKIYADKASVVGSIGVLMNGFGFVDTLDKLGVERRLLTAGKHKGLLDPFSPLAADELAHANRLLGQIHRQFIEVVKAGRGDRLADEEQLFSGLIWTGEESVSLGLVDALGDAGHVAREVIGVETVKNFTPRQGLVERFSKGIGASIAQHASLQALPMLR